MAKRTKGEQLQREWDSAGLMEADIEYRPNKGWFVVPMETRWIGDEGDWLGRDFDAAMRAIEWLRIPWPEQR